MSGSKRTYDSTDGDAHRSVKKQRDMQAVDKIAEVKARIAAQRQKLFEKEQKQQQQHQLEEEGEVGRRPQQVEMAKVTSNVPKPEFATSKANLKRAEELRLQKERDEEEARKRIVKNNPYFNSFAAASQYDRRRIRPTLKFVEPGTHIREAERIRKEFEVEELKRKIAERTRRAGLDAELEMVGENAIQKYSVPLVDWWDAPFYSVSVSGADQKGKEGADMDLVVSERNVGDLVTNLIHHPAKVEPPTEDEKAPVQMVMLTARERKRARRLRRMEGQKERREKIRLGLLPKEEPRLTMSNVMRVLGTEAVLDPTAVEALVKTQTQKRLEEHLRANEERKLTPEERSEKNWKRHEEVSDGDQITVVAFKVKSLTHPSHRFKVIKNAEQHHLTGVAITYPQCNIVVVEGGPKGTRKYKQLMIQRIDWTAAAEDDGNECQLLWEGVMQTRNFRRLKIYDCETPEKAREILGSSFRYLWDLARSLKQSAAI